MLLADHNGDDADDHKQDEHGERHFAEALEHTGADNEQDDHDRRKEDHADVIVQAESVLEDRAGTGNAGAAGDNYRIQLDNVPYHGHNSADSLVVPVYSGDDVVIVLGLYQASVLKRYIHPCPGHKEYQDTSDDTDRTVLGAVLNRKSARCKRRATRMSEPCKCTEHRQTE